MRKLHRSVRRLRYSLAAAAVAAALGAVSPSFASSVIFNDVTIGVSDTSMAFDQVTITGTGSIAANVDWTETIISPSGTLAVSDNYRLDSGETLSVQGVLDASTLSPFPLAGAITIANGGSAQFETLTTEAGSLLVVQAGGLESGTTLNLAAGSTHNILSGGSRWTNAYIDGTVNSADAIDWRSTDIGATGKMTVTGAYSLDGGRTVRNAGTFDATGVRSLISQGTMITQDGGETKLAALTLQNGASNTVQTGGKETGTTLTVNARATEAVEAGASISYSQIHVASSGALVNNGTVSASSIEVYGSVTGTGAIRNTEDGELTVAAGAALSQDVVDVKTVTNKGNMALTGVGNFGSDQTFVMSGTTAQLAVASGWFSGTNLVFEGGAVVYENELNADGELGANNVTIKGNATPTITTSGLVNGATFTDMTTVYVSKLKDETTVDIQSGGHLVASEFDVAGVNVTLNQGGAIDVAATSLLKESDKFYTIRMDATSTAGKYTGTSAVITNVDGYEFNNELLSGMTLNGGVVALTSNDVLKSSLYRIIQKGLGTSVTTVYNGAVTLAGLTGTITIDQTKDFITEQSAVSNTPIIEPGLILAQYVLAGDSADAEVKFADDGDITAKAIGFSGVNNATGVRIGNGHELALIGVESVYGDTNVVARAVAVEQGGKFTLGSDGTDTQYSGSVGSVENNGAFHLKNGAWKIIGTLSGSGSMTLDSGSTLSVGLLSLTDSENGGTVSIKGAMTLDGSTATGSIGKGMTVNVKGQFDASKAELSNFGNLNVQDGGNAYYTKYIVKGNASSTVQSGGVEVGENLDIEYVGTHTVEDGALSEWDTVKIGGTAIVGAGVEWPEISVIAGGTLKVKDSFAVAEGTTIYNAGTIDATGLDNLQVDGTITLAEGGVAHYADMTLKSGSSNTVKSGAAEYCGTLTIQSGARQTVESGGSSEWDSVKVEGEAVVASDVLWKQTDVAEGGTMTVSGSYDIGAEEAVVNKGTFTATAIASLASSGSFTTTDNGVSSFSDLVLQDGAVHSVEGGTETGKTITVKTGALYSVSGGTSTWNSLVLNGGAAEIISSQFSLSTMTLNSGSLTILPNPVTAAEDPGVARLSVNSVNAPISTGNVALTVGTVASGDSVATGDVYFGADSVLAVDATAISATNPALKGNGTGTLTVKAGSVLEVSNATWGKHYLVSKGFGSTKLDSGAWNGAYIVNTSGENAYTSMLGSSVVLHIGDYNGDTSISALSKRYLVPSVIDALINTEENLVLRDLNSASADVSIIERMLDRRYAGTKDNTLNKDRSVTVLNSVMGIAAASGFHAYAANKVMAEMNQLDAVMSGTDFSVRRRVNPDHSLWAKAIAGQSKTSKLKYDKGTSGYKVTETGIVLGGDIAVDRVNRVGASFHFISGDLKSRGDLLSTKTSVKTMGGSLYGVHDAGRLRLTGQLGYSVTDGDIKQSFTDEMKNSYSVKGSTKAKNLSLGVRAEFSLPFRLFDAVPHFGLHVAKTTYTDINTSINGSNAFKSKTKNALRAEAPFGLTLRALRWTRNGWMVQPYVDFTFAPQFGDKTAETTVSAVNYAASGTYKHDVTGSATSRLSFGFEAGSRAHKIGFSYSGAKGGHGQMDHALTARYKFSF